jgi:phosphoribosylformylglycinamidine synthase
VGFEASLADSGLRPDALLFGESASRAVVSCAPGDLPSLLSLAEKRGVPARAIGRTGGERLALAPGVDVPLAEAHDQWARALPEALR